MNSFFLKNPILKHFFLFFIFLYLLGACNDTSGCSTAEGCNSMESCNSLEGCKGPKFLGCSICTSKDWLGTKSCLGGELKQVCIPCERICKEKMSGLVIAQMENPGCQVVEEREPLDCNCDESNPVID